MSWLIEWKAISAQIQGLLEASRFYIESLRDASKDLYMVGNRELLPHIKKICLRTPLRCAGGGSSGQRAAACFGSAQYPGCKTCTPYPPSTQRG